MSASRAVCQQLFRYLTSTARAISALLPPLAAGISEIASEIASPPRVSDSVRRARLRGGGATLSRLLPILLGRQHCRILMLGLDAAGKTTLLYQLKLGEHTATVPTLGFNVETVSYRNIEFMVWDMGGQDKIRQLWSHYYEGTQALIFVVDSADAERMDEARQELHKLMEQEELKDAVLLVYANKQDVAGALSVQQVAESLQLGDLPDSRVWYLQACAAASADGAGVTDGLDWLAGELAKRK